MLSKQTTHKIFLSSQWLEIEEKKCCFCRYLNSRNERTIPLWFNTIKACLGIVHWMRSPELERDPWLKWAGRRSNVYVRCSSVVVSQKNETVMRRETTYFETQRAAHSMTYGDQREKKHSVQCSTSTWKKQWTSESVNQTAQSLKGSTQSVFCLIGHRLSSYKRLCKLSQSSHHTEHQLFHSLQILTFSIEC